MKVEIGTEGFKIDGYDKLSITEKHLIFRQFKNALNFFSNQHEADQRQAMIEEEKQRVENEKKIKKDRVKKAEITKAKIEMREREAKRKKDK